MVGLAGEDGKGVLGDLMGHDPSDGGEREDCGGNGVAGADLCIGHSGCAYVSLDLLVSSIYLLGAWRTKKGEDGPREELHGFRCQPRTSP